MKKTNKTIEVVRKNFNFTIKDVVMSLKTVEPVSKLKVTWQDTKKAFKMLSFFQKKNLNEGPKSLHSIIQITHLITS